MLESKMYITCAACSQPLAAHIIQLSVSRYTFVYHDIQLYIAIYNEKCFLRNLSQDRSWHTKSQMAHFLQKKQFWADLSHSFGESMTATQFKLIHLFGAKPPALRAPGPPDAPNNGDAKPTSRHTQKQAARFQRMNQCAHRQPTSQQGKQWEKSTFGQKNTKLM